MTYSSEFSESLRYASNSNVAEVVSWEAITCVDKKKKLYSADSEFREGYADFLEQDGACLENLRTATYLLFKPEAIAGRRAASAIDFLEKHDFSVIFASEIDYTPSVIHRLWRYQINVASLQRIRAQTRYNSNSKTLLVVLVDNKPHAVIPSSLRLKRLKGTASPNARDGTSLRDHLGSTNLLLNFVHSPDEPADVLRELNILLQHDRRAAAFSALLGKKEFSAHEVKNIIRKLERERVEHDLDPLCAAARLLRKIDEFEGVDHSAASRLISTISCLLNSPFPDLNLDEFGRDLKRVIFDVDPLDVFCLLVHRLEPDLPNAEREIGEDGFDIWKARELELARSF